MQRRAVVETYRRERFCPGGERRLAGRPVCPEWRWLSARPMPGFPRQGRTGHGTSFACFSFLLRMDWNRGCQARAFDGAIRGPARRDYEVSRAIPASFLSSALWLELYLWGRIILVRRVDNFLGRPPYGNRKGSSALQPAASRAPANTRRLRRHGAVMAGFYGRSGSRSVGRSVGR